MNKEQRWARQKKRAAAARARIDERKNAIAKRDRVMTIIEAMVPRWGKDAVSGAMRRLIETWQQQTRIDKATKALRSELRALQHRRIPR